MICFGSVVVAGVAGALATRSFSFLAFLLIYAPVSFIVSGIGAVYALRAYRALPRGHWGRLALNVVIALAVLGLVLACLVIISFGSHPAGGF